MNYISWLFGYDDEFSDKDIKKREKLENDSAIIIQKNFKKYINSINKEKEEISNIIENHYYKQDEFCVIENNNNNIEFIEIDEYENKKNYYDYYSADYLYFINERKRIKEESKISIWNDMFMIR